MASAAASRRRDRPMVTRSPFDVAGRRGAPLKTSFAPLPLETATVQHGEHAILRQTNGKEKSLQPERERRLQRPRSTGITRSGCPIASCDGAWLLQIRR